MSEKGGENKKKVRKGKLLKKAKATRGGRKKRGKMKQVKKEGINE